MPCRRQPTGQRAESPQKINHLYFTVFDAKSQYASKQAVAHIVAAKEEFV